ncbi:uncharacterized protein LAJ45_02870 [Morchella importuna]|uniref:uncharacterized protein n=1 Tax=Morchella importuna TaxID=1174673 RepID=UPI001E8EB66F|nr:uncharacterized protein LAJ45_02870 [Morchella importuna]KAH8153283.1 hypothetical protein LAJ45_02870 [Morchella importuna]
MKQYIQVKPFGGLLTPTHPYLSLRHQTSHRLSGTEPPRALASSKTSYMSFSSAESRAFIPQPSPLLTEVDPGPILSRDAQARPELKVIIQPPLASQNVETGTWRSQPRIGDSEYRRRYRSGPSRRRGATSLGEAGSDAPQQNQPPSIGHRASFGHAMPADLNSMIYVPNLEETFNRGAVPLNDIKEASERQTITPENILDRSQTPLRQSARHTNRVGTGRVSHENNRGFGNTAPTRPLSGQFDGESAPTEETNPPPIAKTFVRPIPPLELLDYPVAAVLGRVGIDIVGVEEISFFRKTIFMSIASELIDDEHPPPPAILLPTDFDQKTFWKVKPSRSFLPFRLNLPLNVGPGPFQSVRARIRYIIHGTVMYTVNGRKNIVRCCRDIRVISALDPERALLPLETPLLTTEEGPLRWGGYDTLKVTAGLHRAVWVSGTVAYVDVNIVNNTRRRVNTIRLKLRRHILAYKNTVALAENKSAGHLRVPSWIEHKTLAQSELNVGRRWKGVKGNQLDVVTCEIEIPRNQLSVKMGRFFEVKYFVDVAVCTLAAKTIRCQLPLTIIHMNSLDIMPNHLLQVAEAFGEKYGTGRGYQIAGLI